MSDLLKQIKLDQVMARKASDDIEASILTTLLGEASPSGNETVTDAQVQSVITRFLKNLNEVYPLLTDENKRIIASHEMMILKEYLPTQIEGVSLENLIYDLINYDGCDNLGKVMKALNGAFGGQFNGKEASAIAKNFF